MRYQNVPILYWVVACIVWPIPNMEKPQSSYWVGWTDMGDPSFWCWVGNTKPIQYQYLPCIGSGVASTLIVQWTIPPNRPKMAIYLTVWGVSNFLADSSLKRWSTGGIKVNKVFTWYTQVKTSVSWPLNRGFKASGIAEWSFKGAYSRALLEIKPAELYILIAQRFHQILYTHLRRYFMQL